MTDAKPGLVAQLKSYPAAFWVANTMEIFERMAWYGFFAVSSLYLTGPVETGALGFTSEQRGQLQAIVPFFLYLMPVFTGALADRYGYKKMFILAYLVMVGSYYALGQFTSFYTFLVAFMFVAVGAAMFKPVVVGTIARVTDASNSATGFGVFYMMVNIGGFVGPIVAGVVRGASWDYVFIACASWAAINLIIVLLFYKDPSTESGSEKRRTFQKVLDDTVEVLGNLRFFITVFTVLIAMMVANQGFAWFNWTHCVYFVPIWLVVNLLYDRMLPAGSGLPVSMGGIKRNPLLKRMYCSNWRFALFLLIMSGFWTSFQQIFITMPEYIRDYTDTRRMVNVGRSVFNALGKPEWIDKLAAVEEAELFAEFDRLARNARGYAPLLPPESRKLTEESLDGERINLNKDIEALLRNVHLSKARADELRQAQERLSDLDAVALDRAREVIAETKKRVTVIRTQLKRELLPTTPGLTDEDLRRLERIVQRINAPNADAPLTVLDLVEGSRTLLQYKVRIEPAHLGDLLSEVVNAPSRLSEDAVDEAVAAVNRRLGQAGKARFEGADRTAVADELQSLLRGHGLFVPHPSLTQAAERLSDGRTVEPKDLAVGVRTLAYRPYIWDAVDAGRQVNPEHIVNIDALSIVLFQVLVSYLMARFHRFTTMIVGMVVAAVGIGLPAIAGGAMIGPIGGSLLVVIVGIVTFAFGEMMASPTSQEYVGRIAPRDKVALYMGYYFVAIALGNLFSGILSGQLYGKLARDMHRPDLMWLAFGGVMFATALVFLAYNRFALPGPASDASHDASGA